MAALALTGNTTSSFQDILPTRFFGQLLRELPEEQRIILCGRIISFLYCREKARLVTRSLEDLQERHENLEERLDRLEERLENRQASINCGLSDWLMAQKVLLVGIAAIFFALFFLA